MAVDPPTTTYYYVLLRTAAAAATTYYYYYDNYYPHHLYSLTPPDEAARACDGAKESYRQRRWRCRGWQWRQGRRWMVGPTRRGQLELECELERQERGGVASGGQHDAAKDRPGMKRWYEIWGP